MGRLHAWLPHDLHAEEVVFLPDVCPGKSPLPTGTAVLTHQADWRRFAASDCGCGMRLLRSRLSPADLGPDAWDAIAEALRRKKGGFGDLGGGNHFLDSLAPYADDRLHLPIHTGSCLESGHVDALVDEPEAFDREFNRAMNWAAANRAAIHEAAQRDRSLIVSSTHAWRCWKATWRRSSASPWSATWVIHEWSEVSSVLEMS